VQKIISDIDLPSGLVIAGFLKGVADQDAKFYSMTVPDRFAVLCKCFQS
jgi:hypothetical protein